MRLLLDTHSFIRWHSATSKLSARALDSCQDPDNDLILSVASILEMQIKIQIGKLKLNLPLDDLVKSQQQTNHIEVLPIILNHVVALESLEMIHKLVTRQSGGKGLQGR